jgi:hypothetical protein
MARVSLGGGSMYLFRKQGNTKLVITAHGGKEDNRFKPPGKSLLWFCSMHGKSTRIDVNDIIDSLTDGGTLDQMRRVGFHPHPFGDITDYSLEKFAGKHGGGKYENYDVYEKLINKGVDILSPRSGWEITLSYVLNDATISSNAYKNIYCSFCRS